MEITKEEKELLIKDLLPRLQYGVKIQTWYNEIITSDLNTFPIGYDEIDIEQLSGIKPYLRPMSSMTEEELNQLKELGGNIIFYSTEKNTWSIYSHGPEVYDWLNAHHFDYRGLIEKGLALEAPEGMYGYRCEDCQDYQYCSQSEYIKAHCYKLQ